MVAFPNTFDSPLAKECRGLIVSKNGKVLRRPFQKFFNVNEKEFTHVSILDTKTIHSVREKVDGSMVAPWVDELGDLHFDTKKLNMEMRAKIDELVPENIRDFAKRAIQRGYQPIFELFHPDIPETNIVIQYNVPTWRLLAIRMLESGKYLNDDEVDEFATIFCIQRPKPYRELENKTTSEIVDNVKTFTECEGVIIRYTDGTIAKVKCDWYLKRHKIVSIFNYRHHVAGLIVNNGNIDDLAPMLSPERRRTIDEIGESVYQNIGAIQAHAIIVAQQYKTKKELGLSEHAKSPFSNIIFRLIGVNLENSSNHAVVFNMVKDNLIKCWVNKSSTFAEWEKIAESIKEKQQ